MIILFMKFPLAFVVFLLFSVASLEINKTVEGSRVLNVGQTLSVRVLVNTVTSVEIIRIEDPIPEGMIASDYPVGCSIDNRVLKCNYGTEVEGKITIPYKLTADRETKDIAIGNAKVLYEEKGIPSTMSSNDIPYLYYIGPPKLQMNISRVRIDDELQYEKYMALPKSPVSLTFSIQNAGKVTAENVTLSLSINNWGIFKTENINPIKSEENLPFQLAFAVPEHEGKAKVDIKLTWKDPIEHVSYEATTYLNIEVSRPKVSVERDLDVKWKPRNGEVIPTVQLELRIKNSGKIPARVEVIQKVPNLTNIQIEPIGQTEEDITTINFELEGGEDKKVLITGETAEGVIFTFPGTVVNYYDKRGYKYENFTWSDEPVGTKKSVWAFIYSFVYPVDKIAKIISILLVVISAIIMYRFWKVGDPNWLIFIVPLLLGLLLAYSFYQVEGISWIIDLILFPFKWLLSKIKDIVFPG